MEGMQVGSSARAAAPHGAAPWPNEQSWAPTTAGAPSATAQSAAPTAAAEPVAGQVQLLKDNAMARELIKQPEPVKQPELTQAEMAVRYRDKAQIIKGSSLFIGDSAFCCKRTHDQYGQLLEGKKSRHVECGPSLEREMARFDSNGLFFYESSKGGTVKELAPLIIKMLERLQKAAERAGLVAPDRFAVFEFGVIAIFHNDHWENNRCRQAVTYKSQIANKWGSSGYYVLGAS